MRARATRSVACRAVRRRAHAGFGLIEVLVTMSLIVVSGAAILNGVVVARSASERAELRSLAIRAARDVADRVLATPFEQVVARWGPGGSEGATFEVPGLGSSGPAGRVRLLVDETITDAALGMALGMPQDLDGDGLAETKDVSAQARLLPVIVEVVYRVAGGATERFRLPVILVP